MAMVVHLIETVLFMIIPPDLSKVKGVGLIKYRSSFTGNVGAILPDS
jgi:hypothetical protein